MYYANFHPRSLSCNAVAMTISSLWCTPVADYFIYNIIILYDTYTCMFFNNFAMIFLANLGMSDDHTRKRISNMIYKYIYELNII